MNDVKAIKEGRAHVNFPTNEKCVENTNNYDISSSSNSLSHIPVIAKKVQFVPSQQHKLILLIAYHNYKI